MKRLFAMLMLGAPVYADHMLMVLGGSGFSWTSWNSTATIAGDVYKAGTNDSVFMRENYLAGIRYSSYDGRESGHTVLGIEATVSSVFPLKEGQWNYTHANSDGAVKFRSAQVADWASVPSANMLRFSGHFGIAIPLNATVTTEFGALVGLGIANAKYKVQYPDSLNVIEDFGGIGAHVALRAALQFYPEASATIGIEYRLLAEGFVSASGIFPWLYTSSATLNYSGHLFLVTVGYRFGRR